MKKLENPSYLYEVKFSMSSNNLEFVNSFIGEILQRFTKLGIINVNFNITKIKDTDTQSLIELPVETREIGKLVQKGRGRKGRALSTENIKNMKEFIRRILIEKGSASRKELLNLLKEEFKNRYREATIVQKGDSILKEFLETGVIAKKSRGVFEIVEATETHAQA
ncbi:MAG: hypothetical protein N2260_04850 [Syntrophobacterales bacterium]|nr:hypothetical protein [Syntrophobacterales bacterium]